jgi:hypothetical protein
MPTMTADAMLTFEPMTDDERKQLTRLAEDAMAKALIVVNPSHAGAQRVQTHGSDIMNAIIEKVRELSTADEFKDEEVVSKCGYVSGYRNPKRIIEQNALLRQVFPGIGFADESLARRPLPERAEGWFAIPRWETIAPSYGEAVEKVLTALSDRCDGNCINYREGKLGDRYFRQTDATRAAFQKLGEEQKGYDILLVAAQFGIVHRGRSVRRARAKMRFNEFGLGAFAVGIMLLTHPVRLKHYDDLWIDCAGDEYSPDGDGKFENSPYFGFYGGWLEFQTGRFEDANDLYGSASGFLPQE